MTDPTWIVLEDIYKQARDESVFGSPVMELPLEKVMRDPQGRVFVDLRVVIDQMQLFIAKAWKE